MQLVHIQTEGAAATRKCAVSGRRGTTTAQWRASQQFLCDSDDETHTYVDLHVGLHSGREKQEIGSVD